MARDFRAKQLRTSVIIGSGAIESNKNYLGLAFYSASKASNFDGGITAPQGEAISDANGLSLANPSIGNDVWCLFDGSSKGAGQTSVLRDNGSTVLFLGDVVISGSLFAERSSIEVDTTTVGRFFTANNSHIGQKTGTSQYALRINPTAGADADGTVANSVTVGNDGGTTNFISLNSSHFGANTGFADVGGGVTIKADGELSSSAGIYTSKFFHAGTGTENWARTAGSVRTSTNIQSPLGILTDIQAHKVTASLGVEVQDSGETLKMVKIGSEMVLSSSTDVKISAGPIVNGSGAGNVIIDGSVALTSAQIDRYLRHNGDGDTYFEFPDAEDEIKLVAGGKEFLHIVEDETGPAHMFEINPNALDIDFKVWDDTLAAIHLTSGPFNDPTQNRLRFWEAPNGSRAAMDINDAGVTVNPLRLDTDYGDFKVLSHTTGKSLLFADASEKMVSIEGDGDGDTIFKVTDGSTGTILNVTDTKVTIGGDLEVNGTTTTVNSTTITVDDTVLTLGGDTAPQQHDFKDRGIEFRYYASGPQIGFMGWDEDLAGFALYHAASNNNEIFSGTKSDLTVGKLLIDGTANHIDVTNSKLTITSDDDIVLNTSLKKVRFTDNQYPHLELSRTNIVQAGHTLGTISLGGNEGSGFTPGAEIVALASEAWDQASNPNQDCATSLMIKTRDTDSNSTETRLTVLYNGNVGVGTVSPDDTLHVHNSNGVAQRWSGSAAGYATMQVFGTGGTRLETNASTPSDGFIYFDATGHISLDSGIGRIDLADSGTEFAKFIDGAAANGASYGAAAGDFVFQDGDGTAIFMVDKSENSLRMLDVNLATASHVSKKLEFCDTATYIHQSADQTLKLATDGEIKLEVGSGGVSIENAAAQLNFNSTDHRVFLGGGSSNEIMFRDGVRTTPVSLSDLASNAPTAHSIYNDTGPDRARIVGHTSIDSSDFYLNQGSHPANSHTDAWLYIGDDGSSRTNVVIKNQLAMSGSVRLVDQNDGLSQTVLKQDSDILTFEMNQNNGALHTMITVDPSVGLKLGTTAGSGNAGLYFQDNDLSLQKVTHTVEGVASSKCIQAKGHILPQADNSFNLGTADRRFANLYTGDLHLNNMGSSNDVDGTAGNWTIQEGEDNLYVINNLTGKRFKMMLQPVGEEE